MSETDGPAASQSQEPKGGSGDQLLEDDLNLDEVNTQRSNSVSPKKIQRPTAACRNVQSLLDTFEKNKENEDEGNDANYKVFEDELPDAKPPPRTTNRKRKATTGTENFVRINMKRKRFAPKGGSNSKKFLRSKKRRLN
ncbi:hypothetical protein M3Y98_00496600 [Aphelenchoides besseyi]|nr:hypothetical protein M3Y98_00496600 [Aphelenchoides besseyi]KAI6207725.1 hypothetical protein M3Y96_00039200 [Aphelenchoides besseyi]